MVDLKKKFIAFEFRKTSPFLEAKCKKQQQRLTEFERGDKVQKQQTVSSKHVNRRVEKKNDQKN